MATTKTLTPTNQAITLAAFTEKPDNRTNVTNDDKLADAVNALNSNISSKCLQLDSTAQNINLTVKRHEATYTTSSNGNITLSLYKSVVILGAYIKSSLDDVIITPCIIRHINVVNAGLHITGVTSPFSPVANTEVTVVVYYL